MPRADLPAGTVTFLFSDVVGSTRLLEALGSEAYAEVLARHRAVIRGAVTRNGGVEVDTQGDAFFVAFPDASGAAAAADAIHAGLAPTEVRVRIGLHTGVALVTDEGYVGDAVHVGARIGAVAHGGQTVLSAATAALLGAAVEVTDLGAHRLKDVPAPVALAQLGRAPFPPLRTIAASNVPVPLAGIVGREAEVRAIETAITTGARLVTLVGPGGIGKTRTANEVARLLAPRYPGGTWWVDLAPIHDPDLVAGTIGTVIGTADDLAASIGDQAMLLVLDNLEQVIGAAGFVHDLLRACPNLAVAATSRIALGIPGEVEVGLAPLDLADGVALFRARSGLGDDPLIPELVRRLDALPLAIELAAARARLLGVRAILDRLGRRLDVLRDGRRDDGRHSALRATVAWSDELLPSDARALFRRLSLFAGGWTVDDAERAVGEGLDVLEALGTLVDHSLVRRVGDRFSMLETIRAYAVEQFAADPWRPAVEASFLDWALDLIETQNALVRGSHQVAALAVLDTEIDNVRAGWDLAARTEAPDIARRYARAASWWLQRRGFARDASAWLREALARPGTDRALHGWTIIGALASDYGELTSPEGMAALREVEAIGRETGDERLLGLALESRALAMPGAEGAALLAEAIERYAALGMHDERGRATINAAAHALNDLELDRAIELGTEATALARALGNRHGLAVALGNVAGALVLAGRDAEAEPVLREIDDASSAVGDQFAVVLLAELLAPILARGGDLEAAGELLGFVDAGYERFGYGREPSGHSLRSAALDGLGALPPADRDAAIARGRSASPGTVLERWRSGRG